MGDSSIMNLCVVSEGTYEVCSRTIAAKQSTGKSYVNKINVIVACFLCRKCQMVFKRSVANGRR